MAAAVFSGEIKIGEVKREKQLYALRAKIGQLTVNAIFLAKAYYKKTGESPFSLALMQGVDRVFTE